MIPPDRDDLRGDSEPERDLYDEAPPRSIFAATWFRTVLVLIVLGVVGAVAVPYVLDAVNPPAPSKPPVARPVTPPAPMAEQPAKASKTAEPAKTDTIAPTAPDVKATPETKPAPAPAPAAKPTPPPPAKSQTVATPEAVKPAPFAPSTTITAKRTAKAAATLRDEAKPADTGDGEPASAKTPGEAKGTVARATTTSAAGAAWWVQVGAFKDETVASKLAAQLREQNYRVRQTSFSMVSAAAAKTVEPAGTTARAASDQYDVFVSGMPADEINKRLSAKGLAARASTGGVVVKPSLPLRDAVALSKDLAGEGLKVQVKRAGGEARPATTKGAVSASTRSGEPLYRVRVGGFPDRATAQVAAKELEAKGYKPFIARGGE